MILFSGITEYSDRKVIILPRYSIPCLPLSNTVVVCYGLVHCRILKSYKRILTQTLADRDGTVAAHGAHPMASQF